MQQRRRTLSSTRGTMRPIPCWYPLACSLVFGGLFLPLYRVHSRPSETPAGAQTTPTAPSGVSRAIIVAGSPGSTEHEASFAAVVKDWKDWLTDSLGFPPSEVRNNSQQVAQGVLDIQILDDTVEFQDPRPDTARLEKLAQVSGGKVVRNAARAGVAAPAYLGIGLKGNRNS